MDSHAPSQQAPNRLALDVRQVFHTERVVVGTDLVPASPNIVGPILYTSPECALQIRHQRADQV